MALPLSYNYRSLLVRKVSTGMAFMVVSITVFVLAYLLSFAAGIHASLVSSGSSRNLLVLRPGATSESTSLIFPDEWGRLVQTPGLARLPDGSPLVSPEMSTQTNIPRANGAAAANVALRGVDEVALQPARLRIVEGRAFRPGQLEAIVGRSAHARFSGLRVGDKLSAGRTQNREFTIVGVFESGGSAFESEVWMPRTMMSDVFDRRFVSSVLLTLAPEADMDAALAYVNGPAVRLKATRETKYYEDLARTTREIVGLTTVLVGIMAIGAAFAVANTMYASVDNRRREIAMLRTIGFPRRAILLSLLIESMLLSLAACAAGLLLAACFTGGQQDFLSSQTWTVLAYEQKLTPAICAVAVVTACIVGACGALAPGIKAARMRVIEALAR